MKKLLVAVMGILCATALVVTAQDATTAKPAKKKLTAEQQTLRKEMLDKYDTDKNGRLDKTERAQISAEDKDKMIKAGLMKTPKKAAAASSSTNSPAN
jgi:Skp family chaperone for outer membrane proteins